VEAEGLQGLRKTECLTERTKKGWQQFLSRGKGLQGSLLAIDNQRGERDRAAIGGHYISSNDEGPPNWEPLTIATRGNKSDYFGKQKGGEWIRKRLL